MQLTLKMDIELLAIFEAIWLLFDKNNTVTEARCTRVKLVNLDSR